ncbi:MULTISPECIES: 8-amino-7-oxononanoate synthase [Pelosinus]|uniref:8-amino-7-ketopelargonate synthase n=1 Tax=Pelosinus fermentans B4 TaxID=1149862 RepID=I9LG29_9FIRM|nr:MULTISPECIES: 8-amino-7-oxononanoate synthase [Pelosinus]EIW19444.1 8-amino-7-oxononanoate synthase [Pelosinus fermentans B4]EIW24807.1 8-amino-7-oxononanoate synthase [Pelosinus fermentans A11]OAM96085.1 8-amino-7-oxononanoate synthase [Pelosinus fermentans DSM 17108]SDR36201.1 glycine C-acetyltransferase [Pelosinus fermentans]
MDFLSKYLTEIKQLELHRELYTYSFRDAVHAQMDGKEYLILASNNYLGLTHDPAIKQAAMAAINEYGTGSGGARLTIGSHPHYALLEQELAEFKGAEAAVAFNTGYMANVGVISSLVGTGDTIYSDELNHASIVDGCRLSRARVTIFQHSDVNHLSSLLAQSSSNGQKLIVVDGVFSMDGDIAPVDDIVDIAEKYNALVMVDDAHATGVIGPGGHGTAAHFGLKERIHIQMGTFSKALGSEGGFVAGRKTIIEFLINKARSFIYSTALSPATIAAARAAIQQLTSRPELVQKLSRNACFMRRSLRDAGLPVGEGLTPIIPVIVGSAGATIALVQELRREGVIVSAIRPPTVPAGTSRLRITVSAAHEEAELAVAAEKIAAAAKRLRIVV